MTEPQGTVLYVDDNEESRRSLSWLFRQEGFAVQEAGSGQEALRMAAGRPDLVILDVNLPDFSGFEVCKRIREDPATASVPVLHLSASFVTSEDRIHGLDGGADGYLTKPIQPEELVAQAKAMVRAHRAEERARAAARQWQATFDAISDGVGLLDGAGRFLRCNRALAAILHIPCSNVVDRPWDEVLPPPAPGREAWPFPDVLVTRERATAEMALSGRWFQVVADPMTGPDGEWAGAVCILTDITERRQLEEQLLQAQKMDAIGRLAGGIAHDFNSLLTAITNAAALIQQQLPAGDPNRELAETVEEVAWRAAELTGQLLRFSRKGRLRLQPVFLGDPVTETVRLLKRTLTPQVEVESSVPLDLWPVLADSGQLGQVLLNLGLNSRDAMPGGGRLRVEAANVVVDEAYARTRPEARPGEFARLTVTDTGLGIPDDVRQHIFEPFFTTKEFGKGTGLGLAVVYGIVKQHEGWIECTSEPARGARFDVYLPRFTGESRLWAMVSK